MTEPEFVEPKMPEEGTQPLQHDGEDEETEKVADGQKHLHERVQETQELVGERADEPKWGQSPE